MNYDSAANKPAAFVCYFTLLGWIFGYILHRRQPSELSAFHLRQSLTLIVIGLLWLVGLDVLFRVLRSMDFLSWKIVAGYCVFGGVLGLVWLSGLAFAALQRKYYVLLYSRGLDRLLARIVS